MLAPRVGEVPGRGWLLSSALSGQRLIAEDAMLTIHYKVVALGAGYGLRVASLCEKAALSTIPLFELIRVHASANWQYAPLPARRQ